MYNSQAALGSPLRRYIFHRASTKRGRSIFYHKGSEHSPTWTLDNTKQLNCLDSGVGVTSPGSSMSALR
ncbi:hypothetical protein NQZ68_026680 [Dissostichus eleginoides]|nr:hypothetical protein NQZ68_026680 [Dissostichus eleginoides]